MGLIKDSLGAAFGAGQVKNGFNGPQLPFINGNKNMSFQRDQVSYSQTRDYTSPSTQSYMIKDDKYHNIPQGQDRCLQTPIYPNSSMPSYMNNANRDPGMRQGRDRSSRRSRDRSSRRSDGRRSRRSDYPDAAPPSYMTSQNQWQADNYNRGIQSQYDIYDADDNYQDRGSDNARFRPVAIPQSMYGDGQPFLRAYSEALRYRGISEHDFIKVVDELNVAVIPNPEAQIFQKAASIAGWFVPGVESIGIMGSQVVVGIATAVGHASLLNRSLSKANLGLFLPQGLELCLGTSKNVDAEVGIQTMTRPDMISSGLPQDRLQQYGDLIAPITLVLPPLSNIGRRDPIAVVGKAMSQRDINKKNKKHQEDLAKGKTKKTGKLDDKCTWLIIREAKPETLAHWRKVLQQSEAALQQEHEAAVHQAQNRR